MKRFIITTIAICGSILLSCSKPPKPIPTWPYVPETPQEEGKIPEASDMVLIYGGGHHRVPYIWDKERLMDYVVYHDRSGKWHWFFDSFLLLEFMDPPVNGGAGKTLVTGYKYKGSYMPSANKQDWKNLLDYYFSEESGAGAIDKAIEGAKAVAGRPKRKRQIIIGIPEPITDLYSATHSGGSAYWGELNGKSLDFKKSEDRVSACRWYIDKAVEKFKARGYDNIQLAGFYWVAEQSSNSQMILKEIASHINSLGYSFNWIPYYRAQGFSQWKSYGFDFAYLQPNYFFNKDIPYSRLDDACNEAKQNGMDMELEFDDNALKRYGRGYKLRDYMKAFRENGIWENHRLAYYQGGWSLRALKNSAEPEDVQLYHDFCTFVISRPKRETGYNSKE